MITYKDSGVNIEEGYKSVKLIKEYAQKTISKYVLNGLGSFAGMVELPKGYKNPVLVSGTDGVGTKLELAYFVSWSKAIIFLGLYSLWKTRSRSSSRIS